MIPTLRHTNPVYTLTSCFLNIHFNILTFTARYPKWTFSFRRSHQNPECLFCHAYHIPRQSYSPLFDDPNNIWRGVQNTVLLTMQFSRNYLVRPNIFLGTLFSHTPGIRFSLNVRDQVSHSYRQGRIMILMFIDGRWEDRNLWLNASRHSANLILCQSFH
jgi:hypothetical protein